MIYKVVVPLANIRSQIIVHGKVRVVFDVQIFVAYAFGRAMADILSVTAAQHDVVIGVFAR